MSNYRLGYAFLDLALVGVVGLGIALIADLVGGGGVSPWLLASGALMFVAYLIAAVRVGASPGSYIRFVGRRGQPPL